MITTLLFLHLLSLVQAANWNTNVRILATERLDPIISPNGVASHMHSIIGGSAFGAAYNQPDLMKSKCTSFPISVDKSNYWHPKPYWINNNGTSFTPLPIWNRVYYIREKNSPNDWIRPFPEGLRIIVGSPFSKSPDARSFQYLCRVADKFNGPGDIWSDNWNFERDCPNGILVQHKFPPCWDGTNLYRPDQSHMAFPQWGAHYGACPASHPIRLPGIMLEVLIQTYRWAPGETVKGKLAWANGDTTGYGVHADFTNGWDSAILGRALNDTACGTTADITFQECPVFQPFIVDAACSPDKGVLAESTQHVDMIPITRLPGCNPLWASGPKPGCSSMPPDPDPSAFKGTDGPLVASLSAIPSLPTVPGWKSIACIKDSDNMLLNKVRTYDNNVSQTSCLDSCLRSGFSYASIGYAWGQSWVCDCGTGLDPKASTYPGMCNMTCPANSAQGCGGSGAHSVFYAPKYTKTEGNYTASMGCYANPPAGKTGLQDVASYNFTSWNLMTRELCGQACADRKLDWAGIKSGGICYCGSSQSFKLGDGYYVNEALCTDKCAGNKTQACGYWGGLSVFNVSTSGYKDQVVNKAPGYVQCYADGSRTSLTGAQYWDGSLTPQKCQFGCKDLGYALASVYNGNMCLCGDKLSNVAVLPTSMCSTKCSDNSTAYTCGGPGNGELYQTSVVSAQVAAFNAKRPPGWQGCYGNPANNVTADTTVYEGKLTVTRCIAACGELGYPWAGVQNREQCRCSKADPRANTKPLVANNYCTIPCNGDATQQCGGWNYVDVYYNPVTSTRPNGTNVTDDGVPVLPGYKGCFNGSAPLPTYQWWSGQMTVELCQQGCKEIGQPLSALSAGTCSCGLTWTGGSRLTSLSCGTPCGGNANQRCGGWPGQTSLYDSNPVADTPYPPGYMGCWSETSPKALQGFGVWSDSQSVDNCRAICSAKSFTLSGLTNAKQCWCGNALGSASTRVPSQFCALPCPGNPAQNCGQWNTIALYRSSGDIPASSSSSVTVINSASPSAPIRSSSISRSTPPAPSSASIANTSQSATSNIKSSTAVVSASKAVSSASRLLSSSLTSNGSTMASRTMSSAVPSTVSSISASSSAATGASVIPTCIADISTLKGVKYTSNFMTRNTCVFWCKGKSFAFAGVSGNTCMCGNVRPTTAATSCLTPCSGNRTQVCGGTNVVSLLSTAATDDLVNPYTFSDNTGDMGCWVTFSSVRLLGGANFANSSMTRATCAAGCQARGFRYSGTQSSTQCWCGKALDPSSNNYRVANIDCNYKCGGDGGMCGGNSRLSIFDGLGVGASPATAALRAANSTSPAGATQSAASSSRPIISSSVNTPISSSVARSSAASSTRSIPSSALSPSSTISRLTSTSVLNTTRSTSMTASLAPAKSSTAPLASSPTAPSAPTSPPANLSSTADYLGCFADQATARVYAAWNSSAANMTAGVCQAICLSRDKSYTYFGTQLGNQCWCAASQPNLATNKLLDGALCNYACAGDKTQMCGGNSTVSAWGPLGAAKRLAASGMARRRRRMLRPVGH